MAGKTVTLLRIVAQRYRLWPGPVFPAMNSRTLDPVMHLTAWNRAVVADFTFDTPLNSLLIRDSLFAIRNYVAAVDLEESALCR